MAEAAVKSKQREDGELLPSDAESMDSSHSTTKSTKRRSRYDVLEEQWNQKFSALDQKLDCLLNKMTSCASSPQRRTQDLDLTQRQRHKRKNKFCPEKNSSDSSDDDVLSVMASGNFSDVDVDVNNNSDIKDRENNLSESSKKCLFEIFGEDAKIKKSVKKDGITIDQSQLEVIENGFRCKCPNDLSAFSEENYDSFPVSEETDKCLEVPSLDPLVESCLINRHGEKASFKKNKGKNLFSQPCKMIEKIAYKGQQAARLGIVMQLYTQQSLGNLVEFMNSEVYDKDRAVQLVKDIFAISTKSLDQVSRSGAFHHIIRRSVAMSDTALCDLSDSKDFSNLPLTSEGVFGSGLESLLKIRKEKKKQLDDMLPELKRKDRKRKFSPDSRSHDNKRSFAGSDQQSTSHDNYKRNDNAWNNFRIPKIPREHSRSNDKGQSGWNKKSKSYSQSYGRRNSSSGGKLGNQTKQ